MLLPSDSAILARNNERSLNDIREILSDKQIL